MDMGADHEPPDIVRELRNGDVEAFTWAVRAHEARLRSVARRVLRDSSEVPDSVQDAFVSAFTSITTFKGNSRVSTWLHRVVINACLMTLRSARRRAWTSLDELSEVQLVEGTDRSLGSRLGTSPDFVFERLERRGIVRKHVDELPPRYRDVLRLRYLDELDTAETAARLGVSTNAVKIRLHRARRELRRRLEPALRVGSKAPRTTNGL